jgi:hypothetical protein
MSSEDGITVRQSLQITSATKSAQTDMALTDMTFRWLLALRPRENNQF